MSPRKKMKIDKKRLDCEWNLLDVKEFIQTLIETLLCEDVQELKNHIIPEIVWREVSTKMNTDEESLKSLWYMKLHLQLFCPHPIYFNDLKIKLIEFFYEKAISDWKTINWHNTLAYFDGYTEKCIYRCFRKLYDYARKATNSTNMEDILVYLYTHYIPHLLESTEDKVLPRLVYKNGTLSHKDKKILKEFAMENI